MIFGRNNNRLKDNIYYSVSFIGKPSFINPNFGISNIEINNFVGLNDDTIYCPYITLKIISSCKDEYKFDRLLYCKGLRKEISLHDDIKLNLLKSIEASLKTTGINNHTTIDLGNFYIDLFINDNHNKSLKLNKNNKYNPLVIPLLIKAILTIEKVKYLNQKVFKVINLFNHLSIVVDTGR